MDRRAVAATVVSVAVFTAMLLANSAVYAAQNSVLKSSVVSSAELREQSLASLSIGLSAFTSLASVQAEIQGTSMNCQNPQPYLDSLGGGQSRSGANGSVSFSSSSSWSYTPGASSASGDTLVPQFSGYSSSGLNIAVTTSVHETFDGGLPSYSRTATELLHLQVPVEQMVSECLSAISEVSSSLSSLTSCSQRAVNAAISKAESLSSLSFEAAGSAVSVGDRCSVGYSVTITQPGISGVSGTFEWSVFGSGSVSSAAPPPPVLRAA